MDISLMPQLAVIANICVGGKVANRDKILLWEDYAKTQPQIIIPVKHYIHGGMYAREITIPKDTVLTGDIYKFDHFDLMISGDITVSTDTGETKRIKGYNLFNGLSGKKRAGYAHEDTTWVTFHAVTGEDGDQIQKLITARNFEELEEFYNSINREDYYIMVSSTGMNDSDIKTQVECTDDLISIFGEYEHLTVKKSKINGNGVFTNKKILTDSLICKSRIDGKRTEAGRYTNHAVNNNAKMVFNGDDMELVSTKDIEENEEITVNYRDVINTRNNKGDLLCQV